MAKPLTIIMVARNQLEHTKKSLESLSKYTDTGIYDLFFMDNGSEPETNHWVMNYCRDNKIGLKYNYSTENRGYIQAVNQAYEIVDTEYSLTVHNDVVFCKQWFDNIMRRFKDKNVAAVGPVITFAMGPQSIHYAYRTIGCEAKYLLGLFFFCRTDVLRQIKNKTGEFLSSAYGLGDKEELELCYHIRQLGYKFEIARDVIIEHRGEGAFVDTLGSQQAFYDYQTSKLKLLRERLGDIVVDDIYKVEIIKPVKLLIGILTRTNYVNTLFMISMLKLWGETPVWHSFFHIPRGMVAESRNRIIEEALKGDYTHILFIDDDMVFEGDAAIKLICRDVDICSGIAFQRAEPYMSCLFAANDETKVINPVEIIDQGFGQVDCIGGYFLLVKTEALRKISKPWFKYGDTSLGYGNKADETGIGEDVYFTLKAKLHDCEVWIDSDMEILHIGYERLIGKKDYLYFKQEVADGKKSYEKEKQFKVM